MPIIGTTNSILKAGITVINPTNIVFGTKAVTLATTSESLVDVSTPLKIGITIKAMAGNATAIWVGTGIGVNLSAVGFELTAGEQIFIPVSDAQTITIDATTSADKVCYIGN